MNFSQLQQQNILLLILLGLILPITGSAVSILFMENWHFPHHGVHALIELSGTLVAIILFLCFTLNQKLKNHLSKSEAIWISSALISMGILDGFHAFAPVGNNFVWLHSIATFAGGIVFCGVILPKTFTLKMKNLPVVLLIASVTLGILSYSFPNNIPIMVQNGDFTNLARMLNIFGGLGFITTTIYCFKKYLSSDDKSYYLLATHCLLFGSAGILFELSSLWDAAWWWWHILRLAAYLVLMALLIDIMRLNSTSYVINLSYTTVKRIIATSVIGLATIVILGWYTNNRILIQIHPEFAPMQYNTALGFILCGLGIWGMSLQNNWLRFSGSIGTLLLGGLSLLQYIFYINLGIDQLFIDASDIMTQVSHPGRMSPATAFCFILVGTTLLAHRYKIILLSVTACLFLLTLSTYLTYIIGLQDIYGIDTLGRMAIHTTTGFFLIALTFSLAGLHNKQAKLDLWGSSPIICAITLILITLFAWHTSREFTGSTNKNYFHTLVEERISVIEKRFALYRQALLSAKGFFYASNHVDRDEWHRYTTVVDPTQNLPGSNGIGYIDYVKEEDLDSYLKETRADGYPEFTNHPDTEFEDKYIIKYIEPENINKPAIGLDIGFEKHRREGVMLARDTGKTTLTKIIFLVQDNKKLAGFLLLEPVYSKGKPTNTVEQRRKHFIGIVYSPFMGRKFMAEVNKISSEQINFDVYDGTEISNNTLIYKEYNSSKSGPLSYLRTITQTEFAGRVWTIIWRPSNQFNAKVNSNTPDIILTSGILITILFSWLFHLLSKVYGESAKQLQLQRKRLDHIIESAVDGLILIDTTGIIEMYNPACEKLFGYKAQEVLGQNIRMLMPKKYAKNHDNYLNNYIATKQAKIIGTARELEAMHKDGSIFPISLSISEIQLDGKRLFSGIIRDITSQYKAEKKLKHYAKTAMKAKEQAIEASKMKSSFLASMSHEIRTPMNGIFGMAELINCGELSPKQRKYLNTLMGSAEALLLLIDDILDFSKIEAGKLEFDNIPVDLANLTEEVASLFAIKAQEQGVEIILKYSPDTPEHVIGDPLRIRQIINNLVSNAIKFTTQGYVVIEIDLCPQNKKSNKQRFKISVTDTGVGVPKKVQKTIFDKFSQADNSTTRNYGGTGLGLAICRELAHIMGGEIGIKSEEGKGSTFWFTMNLEVDKKQKAPYDTTTIKGLSALIIDDIDINRTTIADYLTSLGIKCTQCSSANKAINELNEAHEKNKPFDFCLVDYTLPNLNGKKLVDMFQEHPNNSLTDFIMMVSQENIEPDETLKNSIFKTYLTKPASKRSVYNAVIKAYKSDDVEEKQNSIKNYQIIDVLQNKTIMVAEDNRVNQQFIKEALKSLGCKVEIASNGEECTAMANKNDYDLIFMDCQMPLMDGYTATGMIIKHYKKNKRTLPPIIALTANAMKGDKQKCLDAGMNDYLTKPVRIESLVKVLKKWLKE